MILKIKRKYKEKKLFIYSMVYTINKDNGFTKRYCQTHTKSAQQQSTGIKFIWKLKTKSNILIVSLEIICMVVAIVVVGKIFY